MSPRWRIELFGGLRAVQADRTITRFSTRKTAALLAFLALKRETGHPREVLVELFWPETDPEAGRQSLRQALTSLRLQLEPPGVPAGAVIAADRSTVQLRPAVVATDVAEFEEALQAAHRGVSGATGRGSRSAENADGVEPERVRWLQRAVDLYRGELLPGFYEEWVLVEQRRLAELNLQALCALAAELGRGGDPHRALGCAQRAVGLDPLSEEARCELIRLLLAVGQPGAALDQFRDFERLLQEELGTGLPERVRALMGDIQLAGGRERPSKRRAAVLPTGEEDRAIRQERLPPLGSSSLPAQYTRFFGREKEIAQLVGVLSPTQGGKGAGEQGRAMDSGYISPAPLLPCSIASARLVTLTGPGGSGKTRLALEVASQLVQHYQDALWFVPLADLADPARISDAVCDALQLPRSPTVPPMDQIIEAFSRRPCLIILDNLEHLLSPEGRSPTGHPADVEPRDMPTETRSDRMSSDQSEGARRRGPADGAEVVRNLLECAPELRCLVTSRQRLDLAGEREVVLSPLPVPLRGTEDPQALAECVSVQLFVDRAQAVRADFQATRTNARSLGELCSRLEGIPLALELAAARASVLTPALMLAQLEDRFQFLVSRQRGVPSRHRSLHAAVDWSYRLLSPQLRRFLARLSIFRGGWTLEAAQAVSMGVWEYGSMGEEDRPRSYDTPTPPHANTPILSALDALEELRECSLILAEERGEEIRFRMLETVREYLREQLSASELADARERHGRYYASLAARGEQELEGVGQREWLRRLEEEQENFAAALEWGLSTTDEDRAEVGLRLAVSLAPFWELTSRFTEGRRWLDGALTRRAGDLGLEGERRGPGGADQSAGSCAERSQAGKPAPLGAGRSQAGKPAPLLAGRSQAGKPAPLGAGRSQAGKPAPLLARALAAAGGMAHVQGDCATARSLLDESAALFRQIGDRSGLGRCLRRLAYVVYDAEGSYSRACELLQESLALLREAEDQRGIARSLLQLGTIAIDDTRFAEARPILEECLALGRELDDAPLTARALYCLGTAERFLHNEALASHLLQESLAIDWQLGNRRGAAWSLFVLGAVAARQEDGQRADSCYQECLQIFRELGERWGTAYTLENLGSQALARGDDADAARFYRQGLAVVRDIGVARPVPQMLELLACALARQPGPRNSEGAARLLAAAEGIRTTLQLPSTPEQRAATKERVAAVRAATDEASFAAAWEQGEAMDLQQALTCALGPGAAGSS